MHTTLHRVIKITVASLALAVAIARPAAAQSFFSTGTNVVGGLDQNWLVTAGNGAFTSVGFTAAHLVVPSAWPQSNWISNTTSGSNGFAPWLRFRQTFDLTGFIQSTASLSFRWGCDDVPTAVPFVPAWSLNGSALHGAGTCGAYDINGGSVVTLTDADGFVSGQNTLEFFVVGNGTTDGFGLNVVSFTAQPLVTPAPEPATFALVGASLMVLWGVRRRKA